MKKVTLNFTCILLVMVMVSVCSFAQNKQPINNTLTNSVTIQNPGFELTDATIDCIQNTGFARCLTDENEIALQKANPNKASRNQFEKWLKPHVDKIKADRAAGKFVAPIYNIPVVIHIVHNGDAVGTGENITDAQALSQIQVLNEDFQRLAGSRGGANTTGAAVDVQISFCIAQQDESGNPSTGVVRHNITPYSNAVADGPGGVDWENRPDVESMKTVTQWDPDRYLNMWTIRPGGLSLQNGGLSGLLGYAQFPDNSGLPGLNTNGGNANTDGVVAGFSVMGTEDLDDGSFILNSTYNLGRTMTHEVGHWVGLRHIWGDGPQSGSCGVDDFCGDTPNAAQPNYACNTSNQSCITGINDQVQNYMDYTNDLCMDTFTQNQKDRVMAVFMNSPRRGILNNSIGCNAAAPTVNFTTTASAITNEGSGCSFTDFMFDLSMSDGGSQNTVANFNVTGTATENIDFELLNNSVSFAAGATTASGNNTITLRINNDGLVENDENLMLSLNVNTTGNAIATLATYTLTITDDDFDLDNSASIIYTDDANSTTGFSVINPDAGSTTFASFTGGVNIAGVIEPNFWGSRAETAEGTTNDYLITPEFTIPVNTSGLELEQALFSLNASQNFELYFTQNVTDEQSILNSTLLLSGVATAYDGANTLEVENILPGIVTAIVGQTGSFVLRHIETTNNNGYLLWDTITLTALSSTAVQTAVNDGTTNQSNNILGAGTTHYRDNTTENAVLSITTSSAFDYGCVSGSVSRSGTGAQGLNGSTGADQVTDKTFTIAPFNTNPLGNVTVDFYFTEAEIAGWEAATGVNRSELGLKKVGATDEAVVATLSAFDTDTKVSGTFTTGIEGTYYFGRASTLLSVNEFSALDLSIYPNPVSNELNIGFSSNRSDVELSLFDIRGRKVLSSLKSNNSNVFETTLNVSSLQSGVYLLNIKDNAINVTKKIIIK